VWTGAARCSCWWVVVQTAAIIKEPRNFIESRVALDCYGRSGFYDPESCRARETLHRSIRSTFKQNRFPRVRFDKRRSALKRVLIRTKKEKYERRLAAAANKVNRERNSEYPYPRIESRFDEYRRLAP